MALQHRSTRRARYSGRTHAIDTRPKPSVDDDPRQVVWYRDVEAGVDHAYPTGTGFLRSVCREVRWTTSMAIVDGTVKPCLACLRVVAPSTPTERDPAIVTESELRLIDGNR